jgi:hypothetical protein
MNPTTTTDRRREAEQRLHELPPAAPADRLALVLGLQLLLWGERRRQERGARAARGEQARRSGAAGRSAAASRSTFEQRSRSGPTW